MVNSEAFQFWIRAPPSNDWDWIETMPQFLRHIGIDYSGAGTPLTRSKALRVYASDSDAGTPREVPPSEQSHRHWSRRAIAEWLVREIQLGQPLVIGIDHGFSFPIEYFKKHSLAPDWPAFLEDFRAHWPTDSDAVTVADVRAGVSGNAARRGGDPCWLRLAERWTASAKSVFQFDVQGQVATSTHAGLPWLAFLREKCGGLLHFWPFDGWEVPAGRSVVAEVYPSLWMRRFRREGLDGDQQAAHAVGAWLWRADRDGSLAGFFSPPLNDSERDLARVEGWILGVV